MTMTTTTSVVATVEHVKSLQTASFHVPASATSSLPHEHVSVSTDLSMLDPSANWVDYRTSSLPPANIMQVYVTTWFSCLINAQPLPAHRPAADDNSLIGGASHDLTDDWSLPMPISVLVWVRSFIEPDVLKTMYRSTIPLRFVWSICSGN